MPVPAFPPAADPRLALGRWYNEQMLEWSLSYYRGGEAVFAALRSFDRVSDHVRKLQPWLAARAEVDDTAAEICAQLPVSAGFMAGLRLDRQEQIRWTEAALAGARRLGDRVREMAHLQNLGSCHMYLGDPVRANGYYRAALDALGPDGPPEARAMLLGNIGLTYLEQGRFAEALQVFEEELTASRTEGSGYSTPFALFRLGNVHLLTGRPRKAIAFLEESLEIHTGRGDPAGRAEALNSLGIAWTRLGDPDRAIGSLQQSLAIKRQLGNAHGIANTMLNLGVAYLDRGNSADAAETLEEALRVIDTPAVDPSGNLGVRGKVMGTLGRIRAMQGDPAGAERLFRQALDIAETARDPSDIATAHEMLGHLRLEAGDVDTAAGHFDRTVAIARSTGDRPILASGLYFQAQVLRARDQHAAAIDSARAALAIYEEMESPRAASLRALLDKWARLTP